MRAILAPITGTERGLAQVFVPREDLSAEPSHGSRPAALPVGSAKSVLSPETAKSPKCRTGCICLSRSTIGRAGLNAIPTVGDERPLAVQGQSQAFEDRGREPLVASVDNISQVA